ncbi:hypothetical protein MASR2M50_11480 [Thauera sp.]
MLGRVEGGDAGVDEEVALLLDALVAHPASHQVDAGLARGGDHLLRGVDAAGERVRGVDQQHGVAVALFLQDLEQALVAGRLGVDADLERIAPVPAWRHEAAQALDGLLLERRHAVAGEVEAVLHHQAGAAAVAQHDEAVAAQRAGAQHGLGSAEHLFELVHPQDARAAQGGVVHVVVADQVGHLEEERVGDAHQRVVGRAPGLDCDHRLVACGGARGRHEGAAILDGFDVEQDRARTRVGGEEVEHLAEADVQAVAERDEVREADLLAQRPVEHHGAYRVALRDEAELARARGDLRERRVETEPGHQDAQRAAAEQAHLVAAGDLEDAAFERPAIGAERGVELVGHHHHRARAAFAEFLDQAGHEWRGCADDRQVGRLRQRGDVRVGEHPGHRGAAGVDRHDRAGELARQQVAHEHVAHAALARARADHRDRTWIEQAFQVAEAHRRAPRGGIALMQFNARTVGAHALTCGLADVLVREGSCTPLSRPRGVAQPAATVCTR